jgi:hypothetical protein
VLAAFLLVLPNALRVRFIVRQDEATRLVTGNHHTRFVLRASPGNHALSPKHFDNMLVESLPLAKIEQGL